MQKNKAQLNKNTDKESLSEGGFYQVFEGVVTLSSGTHDGTDGADGTDDAGKEGEVKRRLPDRTCCNRVDAKKRNQPRAPGDGGSVEEKENVLAHGHTPILSY